MPELVNGVAVESTVVPTGQSISGQTDLNLNCATGSAINLQGGGTTREKFYATGGMALDGGNDPGAGNVAIGNNQFIQARIGPTGTLRTVVGMVSGIPRVGDNGIQLGVRGLIIQLIDGVSLHRRVVADADATLALTDTILSYTSLSAARVVTTHNPASGVATSTQPQIFCVGDDSGSCSGANTITIVPGGSAVWKAPAAYLTGGNVVLATPYAKVWFYSDGTNFHLCQVPLV